MTVYAKAHIAVLILTVWGVCGLYTWGTIMADLNYGDSHQWAILNYSPRDNSGMCAGAALLGPIGAMAAAVSTNFNQYGWELWNHKEGAR